MHSLACQTFGECYVPGIWVKGWAYKDTFQDRIFSISFTSERPACKAIIITKICGVSFLLAEVGRWMDRLGKVL